MARSAAAGRRELSKPALAATCSMAPTSGYYDNAGSAVMPSSAACRLLSLHTARRWAYWWRSVRHGRHVPCWRRRRYSAGGRACVANTHLPAASPLRTVLPADVPSMEERGYGLRVFCRWRNSATFQAPTKRPATYHRTVVYRTAPRRDRQQTRQRSCRRTLFFSPAPYRQMINLLQFTPPSAGTRSWWLASCAVPTAGYLLPPAVRATRGFAQQTAARRPRHAADLQLLRAAPVPTAAAAGRRCAFSRCGTVITPRSAPQRACLQRCPARGTARRYRHHRCYLSLCAAPCVQTFSVRALRRWRILAGTSWRKRTC